MLLFFFLLTIIALTEKNYALNTGDKVDEWVRHPVRNPEELGDYFEGDIVLPNNKRAGLIRESSRWPNAEVPYQISGIYPKWAQFVILYAMKSISNHTCIKFRPKNENDKDYVDIMNRHNGCFSYVGKAGGAQPLNLQYPGCTLLLGTAIHELLHAVGIMHEQSRHDRDNYVEILWDNIEDESRANFYRYGDDMVTNYGLDYDYRSVMHYNNDAFTKNGKNTIVAKGDKRDMKLGQRFTMTELDAKKVNAMYNCTK